MTASDDIGFEARLAVSQELLAAAFEQSPTGMVLLRQDGGPPVVVQANAALESTLGRPVQSLPSEDLRRLAGSLKDPFPYRHPDGRVRWLRTWHAVLDVPRDTGRDVLVLVHVLDATADHEAQRMRGQRAATAESAARLATSVLSGGDTAEVYRTLVDDVAATFEAVDVFVGLPVPDDGLLVPLAVAGPWSAGSGSRHVGHDRVRRLLDADRLREQELMDFASRRPPAETVAVWLSEHPRTHGVLLVTREVAQPLATDEVDVLSGLARQAGLAVELGDALVDQEQLAVLQERHRIARDLNDTVMQDLIALSYELSAQPASDDLRGRLDRVLGVVEASVLKLRDIVIRLSQPVSARTP
ncbi:histidine kinase [Spongisporangium articulatum]|uniref:Histidine kinase n=1 Tax=Spongisporangium articulatum TaxID=3362603 RepID=A0ABW8ALY8_9ACTN